MTRSKRAGAAILAALVMVAVLVPAVAYATVVPFASAPPVAGGGGGAGEVWPWGFGFITAQNGAVWGDDTGDTYSLLTSATVYKPSGPQSFVAFADKNPATNKPYLRLKKNGVVVPGLDTHIGTPFRPLLVPYATYLSANGTLFSGESTDWTIPIKDVELDPGCAYELTFLRGIKANNSVSCVMYTDATGTPLGWIQNNATPTYPDEAAQYTAKQYDTFRFRNPYTGVEEDFVFRFQTYADVTGFDAALANAEAALAAATANGGVSPARLADLDAAITVANAVSAEDRAKQLQPDVDAATAALNAAAAAVSYRYEQTNTMITYGGAWSTANSGAYSAGSLKVARGGGVAFSADFTGTAVSWIGLKGPGYGKARVIVDGGAPVTVDLYAASYSPKQVVWAGSGLSAGTHTLKVEWTGLKTTGATSDYINLDALDVVGTLNQAPVFPTRFEQTDAKIAFGGVWSTANSASYSGSSLRLARGGGAAFSADFTGTSVKWVGLKGPGYGKARVVVDEGAPVTVDLYSATYDPQQVIFDSGELTAGAHTLKVEWTGERTIGATSDYINLDALDIAGTLSQAPAFPTRFEQGTAGIDYSATAWSTASAGSYSGGSLKLGRGVGTFIEVDFTGTSVSWIALTGKGYGQATVTIDGVPETVDLYSATYATQQTVWSKALADGAHTLKIEWTGVRTAGATSDYINIDALDITGSITP